MMEGFPHQAMKRQGVARKASVVNSETSSKGTAFDGKVDEHTNVTFDKNWLISWALYQEYRTRIVEPTLSNLVPGVN